MAAKRDYYEVLGVERSATDKQIAESYRKLALQYHPDRNPGSDEAIARFKEAAEAFEVLSDREKRARYDRYGHAGIDGPGGGSPHFTDVGDIFNAFGDIFGGGIFDEFFGGRRGRRAHKGADVRCEVTLELLEAARGATKTIHFQRRQRCSTCNGSGAKPGTQPQRCQYCGGHGQVIQSSGMFRVQVTCPSCHGSGSVIKEPCSACRGEGLVPRRVEREVMIPAGVDDETRLRLQSEGEPSPNGGPPGDCYCFIHVKKHPLFERDGQHLICAVPITYSQAALGTKIEVPTLEGIETIEIPPGTQSGEVFRLARRGMPDPRHRGVGDLLVQVSIEVPKTVTPRQDELLRELAEVEHTHVTPRRKSFFEKLRNYFVPDEGAEKKEE
ncbi:MAG: molecular chaperone DnaJ [Pirellulales bacterium]